MNKKFIVDIKIQRSLSIFDDKGPYKVEAHREFEVTNDTKLDEIMDIPIGKLILGSAYAPHVADITDVSKYDCTAPTDMCSNHNV